MRTATTLTRLDHEFLLCRGVARPLIIFVLSSTVIFFLTLLTLISAAAPSTFNISGRVRDDSANALGNVAVNLTGAASATTTTDAGGNYSFANLAAGGNYTVTPSSSNFSFSPLNQSFNNLDVDRIGNFVGTGTAVNITGTVTDSNNAAVNNLTISLIKDGTMAGTAQTNALGSYSFGNLPAGASYTVTPTGSLAPSSQSFSSLTTNAIANFKATPSIPSQCNTPSFAVPGFAGVGHPVSVVADDFNGDGKLDLAVTGDCCPFVSILLGTGAGSFSAATEFAVADNRPMSVAAGDLNGDGKLDLAVANYTSNSVSILLGTGTGSFGAFSNFAVSTDPNSNPIFVAIADLNGDGKLDLAVAVERLNSVSILLGTGTGSFGAATTFGVGTQPQSIALGDFNRDGKLDLAIANNGSSNVSILLGDGTGNFGAASNFAVAFGPLAVTVGDFNGDGKLDLAVVNSASANVSILLGTGTGGFSAASNFGVFGLPVSVAAGDFNGDGAPDLAVAGSNHVSILLGTGTGSFNAETSFSTGFGPRFVALGDFNSDGKLDLAVAAEDSNGVSILLNNGPTCNTQTSLTISGQFTDAGSKPLPNVTVTLSGPITRVAQTDVNGNYAFSNLATGGDYAVTIRSHHFIFAPSRADFFNLSSDQTANSSAAPVAVPAPTPSLSDDFNSPTRDPNKWNLGTLTLPAGSVDPQVSTTRINGQLVISPLAQAAGQHYNGYVSANSFDLRNGNVGVEVVKAATGGADTIFAIGSDSDNFFRFLVHTAGAPNLLEPTVKGGNGIEAPLDTTTAQLIFQVKVNGVITTLSINYDPVQHRFMRFRHEPLTNSIIFETSPDGVDYTVQNRVVLQKGVSALTAELSAGTSSPTNPGAAVFDNFALVTSTFQFSAGAYTVSEGDGAFFVTVTRSGSTANAAAVDFATADGTAGQKSKYISAAGTLSFAAGETSKTFRVLIEDNVIAEGDQALNLLLSNPLGSGLNSPARAVLNIADNDTVTPTGNPLDDPVFFVTQHYYDFLSRIADSSGLAFWTAEITQCGSNQPCVRNKRVDVSNAFFYELEFQQTGAYVYRLYRAAYGNNQPFPNPDNSNDTERKKIPDYLHFASDRARVVGGADLAQGQQSLANVFVQRPEFLAKYPANLDGSSFIDAVLNTIKNDLGVDLTAQKPGLLTLFTSGGRGAVMYRLADDNAQTNPVNNRAFIDAEYNRAFVATQYFGYLRRDSDIGGFLFWLGQVSSGPLRDVNKQHAMVCSFVTSAEYQLRFSSVATHTNGECPQ